MITLPRPTREVVPIPTREVVPRQPFAVGVGVGALTGACSTGTAAPTTVSSAAAAQMIWPCRRKLATMERDYRPRVMAVDCHPAKSGAGLSGPT
jgi:hypothetical protein